jgi:hypothetical protein
MWLLPILALGQVASVTWSAASSLCSRASSCLFFRVSDYKKQPERCIHIRMSNAAHIHIIKPSASPMSKRDAMAYQAQPACWLYLS